ncbi:MAG: sensor domain-containing protein [Anaerolineales bacterium]|nr:sensor domain-containing protein [Anaerolineales bacterium]
MNSPTKTILRFFKVMINGQAYLNLLYLLAAFPLDVFYFVFVVTGLSAGIALSIIWVGIPLLLLIGGGWWALAGIERLMAVHWLNEDIPALALPSREGTDAWTRFKAFFTHPVTWRSPLYLLMKFPLGVATFVILTTLTALTLACLSMPYTYTFLPDVQMGMFFRPGLSAWRIDSMGDALLGIPLGLILCPLTLHVTNGLAWLHARLAKVMLSEDPVGQLTAPAEV